MKNLRNYTILLLLGAIFVLIFKYSTPIKSSILSSLSLWATNLVPSMLPIYIILDLALNYGLLETAYKIFKNNAAVLVIISSISGTPTNAKYIKEFYEKKYISKNTANFLLMFSYSPNPLFVLAFSPDKKFAFEILSFIYLTNFLIFCIFKNRFLPFSIEEHIPRRQSSFIDSLSSSIMSSADILILILGIVIVYGVLNTILAIFEIDSLFLSSLLELTNALAIIKHRGFPLVWAMFACTFGGLSIHTQIKSILENTDLSYRYFLLGRLLASIPLVLFAFIY